MILISPTSIQGHTSTPGVRIIRIVRPTFLDFIVLNDTSAYNVLTPLRPIQSVDKVLWPRTLRAEGVHSVSPVLSVYVNWCSHVHMYYSEVSKFPIPSSSRFSFGDVSLYTYLRLLCNMDLPCSQSLTVSSCMRTSQLLHLDQTNWCWPYSYLWLAGLARILCRQFHLRPTHPYSLQGHMTEASSDITAAYKTSNRQRFETDLEVRMDGDTLKMAWHMSIAIYICS